MYLSITSGGKKAILTWFSEFMSCRVIMRFVVLYVTEDTWTALFLLVNFFFCLLACLFKKKKKKKKNYLTVSFALNTQYFKLRS